MTTTQWRYREDPGYAPYAWRTSLPEDEDVVGDIEYRATPEGCGCLAEQQDFCECPSEAKRCVDAARAMHAQTKNM